MTEISLLAPPSTAGSLAYLGFRVKSEHVLHRDLCSCDQSKYSVRATRITHVHIDSKLHMQRWNSSRTSLTVISTHLAAAHRLQAVPPCYLLLPSRNLLHDFCQGLTDTTKL